MGLILQADAESIRHHIRKLRLPRPLNIFLFGFDNEEPGKDRSPDGTAAAAIMPAAVDTAPKKRGPKPGARLLSHEEIGNRLEEWTARYKEFPAETSLDSLAEQIGVSRSQVLKYFSQHLQKEFRLWKMERKIACSQQMLREHPEMQVSDIAIRCGFNDTSNFFRQFKRMTGVTPLEWRYMDL